MSPSQSGLHRDTEAPGDELRAAAKRIRELAGAATPGPWGVGDGTTVAREVEQLSIGSFTCLQAVTDTNMFDGREDWSDGDELYLEADPEGDAAHIALWDPPKALLVAAIFDAWARMVRLDPDLIYRIGGDETLALARAINSSAPSPTEVQHDA